MTTTFCETNWTTEKFAGFLGLVTQEKMQFRGKLIGKEELDKASSLGICGRGGKGCGTCSSTQSRRGYQLFSSQTIHFLDALGLQLKGSGSMVKGLLSFNAVQENDAENNRKLSWMTSSTTGIRN